MLKGTEQGRIWEKVFERQARLNGLLVIKNYLRARHIWGGRLQVMPGELDYTLVNQSGVVGYFDTKCYSEDRFVYSELEPHQVERSKVYCQWRVPSGFVVWFKKSNRVVFYSGDYVARKGPGTGFIPVEGRELGEPVRFDLKPLMERKRRRERPSLV